MASNKFPESPLIEIVSPPYIRFATILGIVGSIIILILGIAYLVKGIKNKKRGQIVKGLILILVVAPILFLLGPIVTWITSFLMIQ